MKLGLGTVQFGLDHYGISNVWGKPGPEEVDRILGVARAAGVQVLDTAHAYGDSETVLGRCLSAEHPFRIVTKTVPLDTDRVTAADVQRVIDAFRVSLDRLRQPRVYGLLTHHARNLLAAGGERLMEALAALRTQGLVQKVGVSVYDQSELDAVLDRFPVDIVQLPFNVLDQRLLAGGALERLKRAGVEVHARSVFLQGLLLMEPDGLDAHFHAARDPLRRLHAFAQARGRTPLETALHFVADRDEIDCAVIGVARHEELEDIVAACRGHATAEDYSGFAVHDEAVLNPALWPPTSRHDTQH
ncbi:MAG: aldo/keto reductase [Burkholderiales bacterium]